MKRAFFLPLDDFSGGIGSRVIDIHEALGGYWDSDIGGLDVRQPSHMVLPPLPVTNAFGTNPDVIGIFGGNARSILTTNINNSADAIICGVGNKIYRSTDGVTWTVVATLQGAGPVRQASAVPVIFDYLSSPISLPIKSLTQAANVATATTNIPHGLVVGNVISIAGANNANYNGSFTVASVPSTTTFTYAIANNPASPDTSSTITYNAPPTRRLYALTIGGDLTSRYWTSLDGITWVEQSRTVWEGLPWDGKIVASMPLPAGSPYGAQGTIVCGFSTDGLTWNIDQVANGVDLLDGGGARPKCYFQGLPHWIGAAAAPWGGVTPYFIDNGQVYALNFGLETSQLIEEVGDKARITEGAVFEGYVYCTDGYNIWIYDPGAAQTVRRIGLYKYFGAPPSFANMTISHFIGGTSYLYVVLQDNVNSKYRIVAYSGSGWIPIGPVQTSAVPYTANIDRLPVGQALSVASRYMDIVHLNANGATAGLAVDRYKLPTIGDIPIYGDVPFYAGPSDVITGWYDGGFIDLSGALHRMYIYAFNVTATETVKVEYQLDNNENGPWTLMGTFTANTGSIWFDAVNHRGVQFRTVRFRITLARGSTTTATPELVALVFVYDKKPEFRSAWTLRIDTNLMVEEQTPVTNNVSTLTQTSNVATATTQYPHGLAVGESVTIAGANNANYNGSFTVASVPSTTTFTYAIANNPTSPDPSTTITWTAKATLGRVWSFLKSTFDIKTLIPLVIPNVEDSWAPGLNVRIVDMPATFDDYRNALKGIGYIDVSVIQPVGITQ